MSVGGPFRRPGLDAVPVEQADPVNHPSHYTSGPRHTECGKTIEVIDVTEPLGFCLGNVVKYVLRADHKGRPVEDLRKARWYLDREISRREAAGS